MSGFEVVGLLLGMFPVVITTVKTFKAIKAGRASTFFTSLSRKLKTEQVIFHEFVRNLLSSDASDAHIRNLLGIGRPAPDLAAWKDSRLQDALCAKLGKEKAENMLEILEEIGKLLQDLNTELSKISSDKESMGAIRITLRHAKASFSQGYLSERLAELHKLNVDLSRLLNLPSPPNPRTERPTEEKPIRMPFLHRDVTEAEEIYKAVCGSYLCKCNDPHITSLGFYCPSCGPPRRLSSPALKHEHEWTFELVFQQKSLPGVTHTVSFPRGIDQPLSAVEDDASEDGQCQSTPSISTDNNFRSSESTRQPRSAELKPPPKARGRSISVSLQSPPAVADGISLIKDLCSVVESATTDNAGHETKQVLGVIGRNKKIYNMCIKQTNEAASRELVCLEDLLSVGDARRGLLRRERMVLAFRLSAVVLQFCLTPWIDDAWSWNSFCVPSLDEDKDKDENLISHLLVQRMFYSAACIEAGNTSEKSVAAAPSTIQIHGEPILTRLGFKLTELAMGSSLREIREKDLKQLAPVLTDQAGTAIDQDTLDLSTCFRLLDSGLIARTESQSYEAVVRACLKHQYRDRQKAGVKGLDSDDPKSFFDNVEEAIITPLYEACSSSWIGI
ncbi:hypothetical protein B0H66DRAFT_225769 [Apodospora peruviana]|uniref:DUF7580 domain-containing protein n=1 Tax=Apodospora peruviana TaxID=516989 RepID=A0AAE0I489_9PEZI|nr:hypothetical protein B0H66DRAFT_225769 [Apodospora peruviana]